MEKAPSALEKTVIDNIRRIRQEKGISQLRLSVFCGTSASYIGLMETYKNIPKLSTIEKIAEALNVSVLDLFSSEGKTKAAKTKSETEQGNEKKRRHKNYEHLKKEFMQRLSGDLDEMFKML